MTCHFRFVVSRAPSAWTAHLPEENAGPGISAILAVASVTAIFHLPAVSGTSDGRMRTARHAVGMQLAYRDTPQSFLRRVREGRSSKPAMSSTRADNDFAGGAVLRHASAAAGRGEERRAKCRIAKTKREPWKGRRQPALPGSLIRTPRLVLVVF